MTAVPLGLPEVPVRPVAERRVSRRIQVGPVAVGAAPPCRCSR
ncbi:4-hydroxy-3-methylbut-2-en-1-yl diphosphate synthase (flavodoxin) OS=Streptomyces fumanus OX=67302 GN=ispG1 PE=3 SV=1 [Streptomyces fumanus]